MNNIDNLQKVDLRTYLKGKIIRNSPIRWKKVGFVMLPHELLFDESLPRAALMVYWVLVLHTFRGKNECNPSLKLLEQETRYSRPSILGAIESLEKNGWLEVDRGHRKVNRYFVKITRK